MKEKCRKERKKKKWLKGEMIKQRKENEILAEENVLWCTENMKMKNGGVFVYLFLSKNKME